jgi:hypothetical protein
MWQNNIDIKLVYKIMDTKQENVKHCIKCNETKHISLCLKSHNICNSCNNMIRKEKYKNNPALREKLIKKSMETKQKKANLIRVQKEEKLRTLENEIGYDNTICKYCEEVKPKTRFRNKRLKCKDCEREEPVGKLKRLIRSRIFAAFKTKNKCKDKTTIEYLGCSTYNYVNWLTYNDIKYTMENRGKEWHIDHVIPLSLFDLEHEEQQLIAFNWRNTMPLSPSENLEKNNKIILKQVKEHLDKIIKYHTEKNILMPQVFIDLFAKHLDAGNPLEPI